ncbi:MAG: MarR family transcriptional regulator [Rubrobacteraceae bacterium]
MDRDQIVDEAMELLPLIGRGFSRPKPLGRGRGGEALKEVQVSPGQLQFLHALAHGPCSVGRLSEMAGVSSPAATQIVDRLEKLGMVERRHDPEDRRFVLVDYAPGMEPEVRRVLGRIRRQVAWTIENMTDEEARSFIKGLQLLSESFDAVSSEEPG